MTAILQAVGLCKRYQMGEVAVDALRDVNFSVNQGEFVAIMGPSGSGKSTLLHLLGGLDRSSEGQITFSGRQLADLNDDEVTVIRRRHVGLIFQFYNLMPTLSAAENVALPLLIDTRSPASYHARVAALLALVGHADRRNHKPDQLSGGEQQRVAIARALMTEPLIVLADEPTGNLDTVSGNMILQLLRRACDERQQTIVMVTHDPAAAAFADRAVRLRDGQIAP